MFGFDRSLTGLKGGGVGHHGRKLAVDAVSERLVERAASRVLTPGVVESEVVPQLVCEHVCAAVQAYVGVP